MNPVKLPLVVSVIALATYASHAESSEVSELFEQVRDHAARCYQHMDAECTREVVFPHSLPGGPKHRRSTYRVVYQGELSYLRMETQDESYDGTIRVSHREYGYDGKNSRMNENGELGNITDQHWRDGDGLPPYRFGIPEYGDKTLVDVLELSNDIHLRETTWQGLDCVQLETGFFSAASPRPPERYEFTIAPDRNYLVVRGAHYLLSSSGASLQSEFETDDWRQLAPRIWLPFRCVAKRYCPADEAGKGAGAGRGSMVLESVTTYTADSVKLSPDHDLDLFQNIAMPPGMKVDVTRDGQIVETLIDGIRVDEGTRLGPFLIKSYHVLWLALGALAAMVLLDAARRWRGRHKSTP